jgi:hypothetical protein
MVRFIKSVAGESDYVPCSDKVIGIKRLDVIRCEGLGWSQDRKEIVGRIGSQISTTHFVMVVALQDEDAGRVDLHCRSLPSSQPRTAGFLAYRRTTWAT